MLEAKTANSADNRRNSMWDMKIPGVEFMLEPLSDATHSVMRPISLASSDWMFVGMDNAAKKFVCTLKCLNEAGEETTFPGVSLQAKQLFNRFPEVTQLKTHADRNKWTIGATDFSVIIIAACWPQNRIVFEDEAAKQTFQYLIVRFAMQHHRAASVAAFKTLGELPKMPADWVDHPHLPLSPYQKAAVVMSLSQEAMALFMDKGTGKTAVAIQAICMEAQRKRKKYGKMYKVLVICPAQVCINWKLEIERFCTVPGKTTIARGQPDVRIKALVEGIKEEDDCDFGIVIIPYDSLVATEKPFAAVPWDKIIADESHSFKDPRTARWKAIKRVVARSKSRMALTGTPVGNSPMDLWSQLEFLGDGLSGFQEFKKFRTFHGEFKDLAGEARGVKKLVGIKGIPLIQERLARLSFAVTKDEAGLNLPDKVYDVHEVSMTPYQAKVYEDVASKLAVELESMLVEGETNNLLADHVLKQLMRLAQVTSGHITYEAEVDADTGDIIRPRRIEQLDKTNPKVDAVIDLLTAEDKDPLGKTIVWACFKEDFKVIANGLRKAGIGVVEYHGEINQENRDLAVKKFNCDPKTTVMVANPQTAGEGLDLLGYDKTRVETSHTYCDREIFFSQNWSSILRSQAEDRAHRRGTRMPVMITDLMVPNTIDEEIRERVRSKQDMARSVTDLREILDAVLKRRN